MKENLNFRGQELLCPVKNFMSVAGGKWKVSILCILADNEHHRYGNIKRRLINITNAMLSQSLQQLEVDGLVSRIQYNEIPPRVEYILTEKGKSIIPVIVSMAKWSVENSVPSQNCQTEKKIFCSDCKQIK